LYGSLHQDAVDHAETLAVAWEWFKCL
jgi:hypothetical protein